MGALTILPIAAFLAIRFKKPIEDTIAPVMFGVVFVLYLSGLITTLTPGVWICHLISIAALGYCVYAWLRQKDAFRNHVLTCGLIAYGIFFAYFLLISCGRDLYVGDDLHRWGAAVRDFFIHKDMFNLPDNYDTAYVYPPALPLWNYYSMEVIRRYIDWSSFLSQYMFQAALALPLFARLQPGKRRFTVPLLILAILCIPLVTGCYYPYGNLHDGIPQGFLAAYILWKGSDYHFSRSPFDLICCTFGVVFLTLTKEIALSVAVLCVMTLFLAGWREARMAHRMKPFLGSIALMGASCLTALLSWQYYIAFSAKVYAEKVAAEAALLSTDGLVASAGLSQGMLSFLQAPAAALLTADSTLPATRMVGIFKRLLNILERMPEAINTLISFTTMLFDPSWGNANTSASGSMNLNAPLVFSLPVIVLLLTLAGLLLMRFFLSENNTDILRFNKRLFLLVFLFCIPSCILVRGIVYIMNPINLTVIWGEHSDTFSIIGMLFFLYFFLRHKTTRQLVFLLFTTMFLLLTSNATDLLALAADKPNNTILSYREELSGNGIHENEKVLYLTSYSTWVYDHDLIHYNAYPGYETSVSSLSIPPETDAGEYLLQYMSNAGFSTLYIGVATPAFEAQYQSAFSEPELLDSFSLYRLTAQNDGTSRLVPVRQDHPNTISWRLRRNTRYYSQTAPTIE